MMTNMSYRLHIDSRDRDPSSAGTNDANFLLTKTVCNITGYAVKWIQLANSIRNVDSENKYIRVSVDNGITYNDFDITVPGSTGFVDNITLLAGLTALFATISTSTTITLDTTDRLVWDLGTGVQIDATKSSARDIIGLHSRLQYTGQFISSPCLASPFSLSFVCPQMNSVYSVFSSSVMSTQMPFVSIPVTSGYGEVVFYEPNHYNNNTKLSKITLSSLNIRVIDSRTGKLAECGPWSMEIELFV